MYTNTHKADSYEVSSLNSKTSGGKYMKTLAASFFTGVIVSVGTLTARAEPQIDCAIPQAVVCQVHDEKGIKNIVVQVDTSLGTIEVVNEDYNRCVTEATVQWDPIVPNYQILVTSCDQGKGPGGRIGGFVADLSKATKIAKVTPVDPKSPAFRRAKVQFPVDLPAFVASMPDGAEAIIASCGHPNVYCGASGEPCLVESTSEQASCPGTTEESPLGGSTGKVCNASC
jgi:hypothetical protein